MRLPALSLFAALLFACSLTQPAQASTIITPSSNWMAITLSDMRTLSATVPSGAALRVSVRDASSANWIGRAGSSDASVQRTIFTGVKAGSTLLPVLSDTLVSINLQPDAGTTVTLQLQMMVTDSALVPPPPSFSSMQCGMAGALVQWETQKLASAAIVGVTLTRSEVFAPRVPVTLMASSTRAIDAGSSAAWPHLTTLAAPQDEVTLFLSASPSLPVYIAARVEETDGGESQPACFYLRLVPASVSDVALAHSGSVTLSPVQTATRPAWELLTVDMPGGANIELTLAAVGSAATDGSAADMQLYASWSAPTVNLEMAAAGYQLAGHAVAGGQTVVLQAANPWPSSNRTMYIAVHCPNCQPASQLTLTSESAAPPPVTVQLSTTTPFADTLAATGEWKMAALNVPAGASALLRVTTGTGHVHLLANRDALPAQAFLPTAYALNGDSGGEQLLIGPPANGQAYTLFVALHGSGPFTLHSSTATQTLAALPSTTTTTTLTMTALPGGSPTTAATLAVPANQAVAIAITSAGSSAAILASNLLIMAAWAAPDNPLSAVGYPFGNAAGLPLQLAARTQASTLHLLITSDAAPPQPVNSERLAITVTMGAVTSTTLTGNAPHNAPAPTVGRASTFTLPVQTAHSVYLSATSTAAGAVLHVCASWQTPFNALQPAEYSFCSTSGSLPVSASRGRGEQLNIAVFQPDTAPLAAFTITPTIVAQPAAAPLTAIGQTTTVAAGRWLIYTAIVNAQSTATVSYTATSGSPRLYASLLAEGDTLANAFTGEYYSQSSTASTRSITLPNGSPEAMTLQVAVAATGGTAAVYNLGFSQDALSIVSLEAGSHFAMSVEAGGRPQFASFSVLAGATIAVSATVSPDSKVDDVIVSANWGPPSSLTDIASFAFPLDLDGSAIRLQTPQQSKGDVLYLSAVYAPHMVSPTSDAVIHLHVQYLGGLVPLTLPTPDAEIYASGPSSLTASQFTFVPPIDSVHVGAKLLNEPKTLPGNVPPQLLVEVGHPPQSPQLLAWTYSSDITPAASNAYGYSAVTEDVALPAKTPVLVTAGVYAPGSAWELYALALRKHVQMTLHAGSSKSVKESVPQGQWVWMTVDVPSDDAPLTISMKENTGNAVVCVSQDRNISRWLLSQYATCRDQPGKVQLKSSGDTLYVGLLGYGQDDVVRGVLSSTTEVTLSLTAGDVQAGETVAIVLVVVALFVTFALAYIARDRIADACNCGPQSTVPPARRPMREGFRPPSFGGVELLDGSYGGRKSSGGAGVSDAIYAALEDDVEEGKADEADEDGRGGSV